MEDLVVAGDGGGGGRKEYRAPMKAAEAKAKGINPILIKNKVFLQDWDSEKFGLTEQVGACPVPPPLVPGPPEPLLCWAALVASPNTGAFFRTPQETIKFQEIYAMADSQNNGYLGRRQFTDLLKLLSIVVEGVRLRRAPSRPAAPLIYLAYSSTKQEQLSKMFEDMDENGDGQIEFDGAFFTTPPRYQTCTHFQTARYQACGKRLAVRNR